MLPGLPTPFRAKLLGPLITMTAGTNTRSDDTGQIVGYNRIGGDGALPKSANGTFYRSVGSVSAEPIQVLGCVLEEMCEIDTGETFLSFFGDTYARIDTQLKKYRGFIFRGVSYSLPTRFIDGQQQNPGVLIAYRWTGSTGVPPFRQGGTFQMSG